MAMEIEYLPIDRLMFYERNARTHSDEQIEQIRASIREFGFTNPVLVDEKGELIAGHGRTTAAKLEGLVEIPSIRLSSLSPSQVRALRIADNQLALNAGWDLELLSDELQELDVEDYDLSLVGFDGQFLDGLLDGSILGEDDYGAEDEEEDTPGPPEDPVSVFGDLWLLGPHRLMCGDSTSIDSVERLTDGRPVSLLVTDPPYNVDYQGKTSDALTIQNDSMSDDDFRQFLRDVYTAADVVMEPGAAFYIWHADSEGYNFRGAAHDVGWKVRQCLIWSKNSMVLGRQDYQWKHEPCLYGWKDGAAHYWGSDRKQTTVLEFNRPSRNGEHPTMKPVALIEYQVKNSSRRGQLVLDLFGGSGSTLIAAENQGRDACVMELDPRYVDVIINRWQNHTGKQAFHPENGKTYDEMESARSGGRRINVSENAANDPVHQIRERLKVVLV